MRLPESTQDDVPQTGFGLSEILVNERQGNPLRL